MNRELVIRKVKYLEHDCAESFPMEDKVNFNVYGVYEYKISGDVELLSWINDFDSLAEAETYIIEKLG